MTSMIICNVDGCSSPIAGYFKTIPEAETAVITLRRELFTHSNMDNA